MTKYSHEHHFKNWIWFSHILSQALPSNKTSTSFLQSIIDHEVTAIKSKITILSFLLISLTTLFIFISPKILNGNNLIIPVSFYIFGIFTLLSLTTITYFSFQRLSFLIHLQNTPLEIPNYCEFAIEQLQKFTPK